ncbi:hypothetical protein ABZ819_05440 [Streptomyces venezuelae]|uniref:hypothetical protein n=1 Tax=Streptomyces venezuelae TaxID=54571 RepID=UPI0034299A0C
MSTETEVLPAEAQELEADQGHYVTASLCGKEVRVIPPGAWRMSWQRALKAGDFDVFASKVMHPEDFPLFEDLDPTNDAFGEFVADAASKTGEALGKSSGPSRSSKSTRKR